MTREAAAEVIRQRFASLIETGEGIPTQYDNLPFDPPQNDEWIRWTNLSGRSFQASLGKSRRWRTPGVAVAQVFVPIETGDDRAMQITDLIEGAFRGVSVNGVTFEETSVSNEGRSDNWYQWNVECSYYFDDVD